MFKVNDTVVINCVFYGSYLNFPELRFDASPYIYFYDDKSYFLQGIPLTTIGIIKEQINEDIYLIIIKNFKNKNLNTFDGNKIYLSKNDFKPITNSLFCFKCLNYCSQQCIKIF